MNFTKSAATYIGSGSLCFWALAAVMISKLHNIPTFQILSLTLSIAFIFTAIKLTICKQWHRIKQPLLIWVIGIIGIYGNILAYIAAFKYAPPVHADLINFLWPILIILFSGLLPKEKFTCKHLIAALVSFAGIYILITNGQGLSNFKIEYLPGYLLALVDAVLWCLYSLLSRHHGKTTIEMIGMYCGIGALFSLCIHLNFEPNIIPSLLQITIMILMGITTQGIAYFLWDVGIKQGHFKLLSILSYFIPLVSVFLLIVFNEAEMSISLAIACLLVTSGAMLGGLKWNKISNQYITKIPLLFEHLLKTTYFDKLSEDTK